MGAQYPAVVVDQGFRDTILIDQGVADRAVCKSPSPISSTTPKVHRRWSEAAAEYRAPTGSRLNESGAAYVIDVSLWPSARFQGSGLALYQWRVVLSAVRCGVGSALKVSANA